MTKGGADYCFECIGVASVMNDAFKSSRKVQTDWPVHTYLAEYVPVIYNIPGRKKTIAGPA